MRALAVYGAVGAPEDAGSDALRVDGMLVRSALVDVPDPAFDARDAAYARQVVVRVSAFSCNYRDKGFLVRLQRFPADRFYTVGSDFVGTVVEVGAQVETLRPGDRVIGQNHYTGAGIGPDGVLEGVPSNNASKEYQVFPESKLARIPDSMSDAVAAGFSIGAQTSYSMVRKLHPRPGDHALVTSATSNTSLFLIAALRQRGARVISTTGSTGFDDRLLAWGVDDLVKVDPSDPQQAPLTELAMRLAGFHQVFDPFYDLNLQRAVELMRPFARYTTCGSFSQNRGARARARTHTMDMGATMEQVLLKNLSVVGNCLGFREDLEAAIADHAAGRYDCMVDSVFTGAGRTDDFLRRTYEDRARLGKVVFSYDAAACEIPASAS